MAYLETEVFGKRLLMTDQHAWSTEEIMVAYHGQSQAEAAFRQLKDVDHLTVRPQYHWTDQKVRVHTFVCLLAFLLCRLIERESRAAGYPGTLSPPRSARHHPVGDDRAALGYAGGPPTLCLGPGGE